MHLGRGALAQLGERVVRNHEVRGSIPLCSTMNKARHPKGVSFFANKKHIKRSIVIISIYAIIYHNRKET